jgi:hypothetical protein
MQDYSTAHDFSGQSENRSEHDSLASLDKRQATNEQDRRNMSIVALYSKILERNVRPVTQYAQKHLHWCKKE